MSILDAVILCSYFLAIISLGWMRKAVRNPSEDTYLLLGRQLTLPGFVLSLVASWYGGILGSSEYSYTYGLSNWIVFGLPYYIFAGFFALFLARRARERFVYSIPDLLASVMGESARIPAAVTVLILASPAPYVLTLGILAHFLFGIPVALGVILGAAFSFLYVYRDGLSVIIRTDLLQSGLMFAGYIVLILFAVLQFGGLETLESAVSERNANHLSPTGGEPLSILLVWFFIGSWTIVSPMFHQRVYALREKRHARIGIGVSVALWTVFDACTTLAGLYAFGFLMPLEDARLSHIILANEVLPIGLYGLFITGLFAVVMSTLDSELFVSGVTFGSDLLGRHPRLARFSKPFLTRLGMAIVLLSAVIMALLLPSVVDLYYIIGTLAIPGLLLPVLSACGLLPKLSPRRIRLHLVSVPLLALVWKLTTPLPLEAFYPALALSVAWYMLPRRILA
jgi:SSS family solute:Na+ symporter